MYEWYDEIKQNNRLRWDEQPYIVTSHTLPYLNRHRPRRFQLHPVMLLRHDLFVLEQITEPMMAYRHTMMPELDIICHVIPTVTIWTH